MKNLKTTKQIVAFFIALTLLFGVLPLAAFAAPGNTYIDAVGVEQSIPASATTWTTVPMSIGAGWYVIDGSTTAANGVRTISGVVNIILADDAKISWAGTGNGGAGISISNTASLNIYGQTAGTGKLTLLPGDIGGQGSPGVSIGNNALLNLYGGTLSVAGAGTGSSALGITSGSARTVTISGGTLIASGSNRALSTNITLGLPPAYGYRTNTAALAPLAFYTKVIPGGSSTPYVTGAYKYVDIGTAFKATITGGTSFAYSADGVYQGNDGYYYRGALIGIEVGTPPPGLGFDRWTTTDTGFTLANEFAGATAFTMPAKPVAISAAFASAFTVTINTPAGPKSGGAFVAGRIAFVRAPNIAVGQGFKQWITSSVALADPLKSPTTFTMPANNVTITCEYQPVFDLSVEKPDPYGITISSGAGAYPAGAQIRVLAAPPAAIPSTQRLSWAVMKNDIPVLSDAFAKTANYSTNYEAIFTMPATDTVISMNLATIRKLTVESITASGEATSTIYSVVAGEKTNIASATRFDPAANQVKLFNNWTLQTLIVGSDPNSVGTFADETAASTVFTMGQRDTVVTANYVDGYNLKVQDGSGTTVDKGYWKAGDLINLTAAPPAAEKQFANWITDGLSGWFIPSAASSSVTFKMPTRDAVVTATYRNASYPITIVGGIVNSVGGTRQPAGATVTIFVDQDAIPGGMLFEKWIAQPEGVISFEETTSPLTTFVMPSEAVSIQASYVDAPVVYKVTFNHNYTASISPIVLSVVASQTANLPATPVRAGFIFTGWNTKADGTGAAFTKATNVYAHTTVYAQWKPAPVFTPLGQKAFGLTQTTIYVVKGTTVKLPATLYVGSGKQTVSWKASKKAVATLVKGKASGKLSMTAQGKTNLSVKALKAGTSKITLTAKNGQQTTITVKVVPKKAGLYTLKIVNAPARVCVGSAFELNAIKSKYATTIMRWKSSNPAVMKVDAAGRVTALTPGVATITLTAGTKISKVTIEVFK